MSKSSMKRPTKPDAITLMSAMTPAQLPKTITADVPTVSPPAKTSSGKAGARAGTCQIAGHFPLSTRKALKHLEAEEGRKLQDLLDEAIHDFLVKKGKAKLVGA
jgi:hypothetical protein